MTNLSSTDILIELPVPLARALLTGGTPDPVRPQPGVRDGLIQETASVLVFAAGLAADSITLILAREHLRRFVTRLFGGMRDLKVDELDVSYRSMDGTVVRFTVRSSDELHDVARILEGATHALNAARGPGAPAADAS
jgi:hypothetical protein